MNLRSRLTSLVAVGGLLLGTGACSAGTGGDESQTGAKPSGTVKLLTPIFDGSEGKQLLEQQLLPKFYKKYPKVKVDVDYTDYDHLNEKLTTALASGLVPDVMMMGVGWVEPFASKGVLADLGPYGDSVDNLSGRYTEQVLKAGVWQDKLYAVPTMLDSRFGIYRKDMFAKAGITRPPTSWEELRADAIKLTQRDSNGKLKVAGLDLLTIDARQMFELLLFSNGGELFNSERTKPTFNDARGVEALQFATDLIRKDKVEDVGFANGDTEPYPIIAGRAAMMLGHNDVWTNAQEANPSVLPKLGAFTINGTQPTIFQGGTLVTMSARSQHSAAAHALLKFLTGPEASLAANEQRGNVPAVRSLLDSDYVRSNKLAQFVMQNLDKAHAEGGVPQWLEIRDSFAPAIESALLGKKSPQDALDDLAAESEEAMNR